MYPNIDEFTEHGQIVIGHIEPIGGVAIASEGRQTVTMLRRRKDEPFKQLLDRLDTASPRPPSTTSTSMKSTLPGIETDTSCDRSCPLELIVDTYGPIPTLPTPTSRRPECNAYSEPLEPSIETTD